MKILLSHGADPNLCDGDGWTPAHVAASQEKVRALHLLVEFKADLHKVSSRGTLLQVAKSILNDAELTNLLLL